MIRVLGYNRFGAFIGAKTRSFSVLCWLMTNTNPLAAITTELADMADVAHIAESLAGSAVHLRVAPLPSAARTPLVAALARHARAPMLYITINAEAALRAADDLRQWLGPEAVLLYPASDSMPTNTCPPATR